MLDRADSAGMGHSSPPLWSSAKSSSRTARPCSTTSRGHIGSPCFGVDRRHHRRVRDPREDLGGRDDRFTLGLVLERRTGPSRAQTPALHARARRRKDHHHVEIDHSVCLAAPMAERRHCSHAVGMSGVMKGHLGIEDKRPDVIALEDEASDCGTHPPPQPRENPDHCQGVVRYFLRSGIYSVVVIAGRISPWWHRNAQHRGRHRINEP
jgi:hypothetical protein